MLRISPWAIFKTSSLDFRAIHRAIHKQLLFNFVPLDTFMRIPRIARSADKRAERNPVISRKRGPDKGRRESPHKGFGSPFDRGMRAFGKAESGRKYDDAMRIWHSLKDNYPAEAAEYVDANPGFAPPYGVHIGKPGSEPWRP